MAIEFDFNAFFRGLDWTKQAVKEGAEEGMHDATDDLLRVSRDLAPKDEGTLRMTAGKDVQISENGVSGEVFYSATERDSSGKLWDYALITHELGSDETMSGYAFKDPTTPGTVPKYLERPAKSNSDRYQKMIADGIRRRLT